MLLWYPFTAVCVPWDRHSCSVQCAYVFVCVSRHAVHNTSVPAHGFWIMQKLQSLLRGETEVGEKMYVCTGSLIKTWGALCGGDKGVICEKAAGSLKDDSSDDEMNRQERWSWDVRRWREESCSAQGVNYAWSWVPRSLRLSFQIGGSGKLWSMCCSCAAKSTWW